MQNECIGLNGKKICKNAVTDVKFTDEVSKYVCSSVDKFLYLVDTEKYFVLRKF